MFAEGATRAQLDIVERTRELRTIPRSKELIAVRKDLDEEGRHADGLVQWGATENADLLTVDGRSVLPARLPG
ncbi:hypothetical protein STENM327S_06940 [Streptomyces tendae]